MSLPLLKKVEDMSAQIEAQKKALVEALKPEFKSIFSPAFEKWPQVTKFGFTQYTPYFNDGEPCEFSVGDLHTCIAGVHDPEESHYEWQDGNIPDYYFTVEPNESDYKTKRRDAYTAAFGDKLEEFRKDLNELVTAFKGLPDDAMEELFGDHVRVTITRDGVDTEEYDHD